MLNKTIEIISFVQAKYIFIFKKNVADNLYIQKKFVFCSTVINAIKIIRNNILITISKNCSLKHFSFS